MRFLIPLLVLLVHFSALTAQNHAPEVTNVTFTQRSEGSFMVDIYIFNTQKN